MEFLPLFLMSSSSCSSCLRLCAFCFIASICLQYLSLILSNSFILLSISFSMVPTAAVAAASPSKLSGCSSRCSAAADAEVYVHPKRSKNNLNPKP